MKRTLMIALGITLMLYSGVFAAQVSDVLQSSHTQTQDQLLEAVEAMAIVHQAQPVVDMIRARRIVRDKLVGVNPSTGGLRERLKSEMSWELISSLPEARLYSLFTAADLGGYGDNEPPFEPGNPYPENGATAVAYDVTLQWTGDDPNPEDMVYYDLYFGEGTNPPLVASSLTVESYSITDLTPGTMYYWRIIARDNWDATTEGQFWNFTTAENDPPFEPVNPIPPDNGTDIDLTANLSWQCNDPNPGDTLVFDVYFGDSSPPVNVVTDLSEFTYDPGSLTENTMYYWYIVARDNHGEETTGPTWSFTTMSGTNNPPYEPSNPMPVNNATGVDINADVSWSGGDPDPGDTVVYDLYFGTDPDPALSSQNLSTTSFDPGTLQEGTMYFWYIVARDDHSSETTGPVWNFTTFQESEPTPTPPPSCQEWSIELDMGQTYFCPGDNFYLSATICNPDAPSPNIIWVLLEVEGFFWFAPGFSTEIDYYQMSPVPTGWSTIDVLSPFVWPQVDGAFDGSKFWGAITDPSYNLVGDIDTVTFGWGPCM